jgi:hypothetical protein
VEEGHIVINDVLAERIDDESGHGEVLRAKWDTNDCDAKYYSEQAMKHCKNETAKEKPQDVHYGREAAT